MQTHGRAGVEQRRTPALHWHSTCYARGTLASSARHRARHAADRVSVVTRTRHPTDRRSRPQRWRDAVKELMDLQAAYADWLATLPEGLRGSRIAEALEAIADLDLADLAAREPPRGYGRD